MNKAKNTWYARGDLIALYILIDQQLDVIERRLMLWNPIEWWMMFINDSPKLGVLYQSNQREIWPIPPQLNLSSVQKVLNHRWSLLLDRNQWGFHLVAL